MLTHLKDYTSLCEGLPIMIVIYEGKFSFVLLHCCHALLHTVYTG